MNPRDTLTIFAEVAVAFAGFAGLAGLLARRFTGEAADLAHARLLGTIEWALIVVAFSLIPLATLNFAPESTLIWRVLSAALAAFAAAYAVWSRQRLLRHLPGGRFNRAFARGWIFGGATVLLINATGVLGREASYYIVGLLVYLLWAMFLFARLLRSLVVRGTESGAAQPGAGT